MIEMYRYTDKELKTLLDSLTVVVDTRENQWSNIKEYFYDKKIPYIIKKLDFGDYSCFLPANLELGITRDLYFDCVIEKKAHLEEISGNLTTDRTRIENEFIRGKDSRFILMIEKKENKPAMDLINLLVKTSTMKLDDKQMEILRSAMNGIGGFEDIINHKYDTQYNENSFIASLFAFAHRYNIDIHFIDKKYSGKFIYEQLKYYVREYLK